MSVKHIKKYFNQICNDYSEMLDVIHELEEEVSKKIISQECLDNTLKPMEKMKENYLRWSYMMYLLNLPDKKKKQPRYKKQFERVIKSIPDKDTIDGVLEENRNSIQDLRSNIESL